MNDNWYLVDNIDNFVKSTRILVYNNFGKNKPEDKIDLAIDSVAPDEQKDFDQVLTQEESKVIVCALLKKQVNKKTKEERYLVNDDKFMEIILCLNDRMVSNILNQLVNKGVLDTAFDDESKDFVFWVKDKI